VRTERQVRTIIEALPADSPAGSSAQKVGDYYRAYLDTDAIERAALGQRRRDSLPSPPLALTQIWRD
jgi:predicted metalloendopeptidase